MYQYSDSESRDSDEGIRFKTDSTRNKQSPPKSKYRSSRSSSPKRVSRRFEKRYRTDTRSSSSDESPPRGRKSKSYRNDKSAPKVIGPVLPPGLVKNIPQENHSKSVESVVIGPALPPQLIKKSAKEEPQNDSPNSSMIGPVLPSHLLKNKCSEDDTSEVDSQSFGPRPPPRSLNKKSDQISCIGPQLPIHLREKLQKESTNKLDEDSDDGDAYGPLPVGEMSYSKAQIALEERALQLKMDQLEPSQEKAPVREEWMLELPEVKAANLGLGPRQFRSKAGPDMSKRSAWTDTPNKKAKNEEVDLQKETELKETQRRDKEQEKIAKKHKKKNKESLLEMHQNELKKKKKEEGGPSERRPFSRDIDLKVNRFDEAQKKAILKKAQLLDDRFSSGQSKFL